MRLAITGTHGTGTTTLAEDIAAAFPKLELVPEPIWVFSEGGTAFLDGPNLADFEEQLEQRCGRSTS